MKVFWNRAKLDEFKAALPPQGIGKIRVAREFVASLPANEAELYSYVYRQYTDEEGWAYSTGEVAEMMGLDKAVVEQTVYGIHAKIGRLAVERYGHPPMPKR